MVLKQRKRNFEHNAVNSSDGPFRLKVNQTRLRRNFPVPECRGCLLAYSNIYLVCGADKHRFSPSAGPA